MKKLFCLFIGVIITASAGAGPSVSGGMPEAPWVRSQDIFGQVLADLNERMLAVASIRFADGNSNTVIVQADCGNGKKPEMIYHVKSSCTQTSVPGLCLPSRYISLDEENSQSCY